MKNLIPHFIQEQYRLNQDSGQLEAFTMFVDLSGFTPLTQSLMKYGNEGAEELSNILNQIFAPMVSLVYRKNGFIPYFAGDAFTAIFPVHTSEIDAASLVQTAEEIRDLFSRESIRKTQFEDFAIGVKIGLSYGTVEWGIVGDQYRSFFFRGPAINNCAESEHKAKEQDIILDQHVVEKIKGTLPQMEEIEPTYYRLVSDRSFLPDTFDAIGLPKLSRAVVREFLPASVIEFDQIGEFRNVITIFISFDGIKDQHHFNEFATLVLNEINLFSGYFKEIDFGDKGGVMLGFFGAPVSFENNVERALEFILSIREAIEEWPNRDELRYRMGVTSGMAYTGIMGGAERCQYAAVGDWVNLAARLMIYADWGTVLVDENIQKTRHFRFDHIGDTQYKGVEGDIPTYELLGQNVEDQMVFTGNMIGRKEELEQLYDFAEPLFLGSFSGLAYIFGEAGIGKTRLAFELKRKLRLRGDLHWFTCQADQILRKPLNPFVYFLKSYFQQSPETSQVENVARFEKRYKWLIRNSEELVHPQIFEIRREIIRTKSILAAQVGIYYPNSLWEQLDAKGKYQNTYTAVENLFKLVSLIHPLILELEDGHWFDEDSKNFLQSFVRQMGPFPILLLVTSRYLDDGSKPRLYPEDLLGRYEIKQHELDLNILSPEALRRFAELWLNGSIDEELSELLYRSTSGNPFYAEQIMEYFSESNLLEVNNGLWGIKDKSIKVTSSINSILMARIDRLSSLVKETVKAAAVIGREFEVPVLTEVMKRNQAFTERNGNTTHVLKEQIQTAEQGQIWRATNELRYIFKHSLLRETVYDMQMRTRLKELHHWIGLAIEKLYPESIEERYVDLAFHYGEAEIDLKTKEYQEKAADFARLNFQNQQALDFYNKLLTNLEDSTDARHRIRTLLKKGSVHQLIGQWDACEEVYIEALHLSRDINDKLLQGKANNNLGHLLMLKGNYESANRYLEAAATFFEMVKDEYGIVNVYGNLGNLYFRQGSYGEAKAFFTRSIQLSQDLNHTNTIAQIIANLGLTYMNQGQYDEGVEAQLDGLKSCEQVNDKQGMATLHTNVGIVYYEKGDYDSAKKHYEKGLTLSEELGNKLLTAIATGCLGSVYQKKGNFEKAMENFIRDLALCEELGDKQGIAIAFGLIGELRSIEGEFEIAIDYLEKNLVLCEELGYQKGIAKAVNTLADICTYQERYEEALAYYDRSIGISRKIKNRSVLCSSLIEKAEVLLLLQNATEEADQINKETLELSEQLGNPELIFDSVLLSAKVFAHQGKKDVGINILQALFVKARNDREKAAIYYELHKMKPKEETYRNKALELYQSLFESFPQYEFRNRVEELK